MLENDANACALAEWRWGAGKGSRLMAFLTFGTGLGAGIVADGHILRGASGDAGELGHWRLMEFGPSGYGKTGSFEGFCSGGGLRQLALTVGERYRQNGNMPGYPLSPTVSAKETAEAARAGDPAALEVFGLCADALGRGLSLLLDFLNPDCVVLGSIYARCQDLLEPRMGALEAVKSAGREDEMIQVTFDVDNDCLDAIEAGEILLTGAQEEKSQVANCIYACMEIVNR